MQDTTVAIIERWKSRALRAEMKLYRAGLSSYDPSEMFTDEEWIATTLEKKDGTPVTVVELQAARAARGKV